MKLKLQIGVYLFVRKFIFYLFNFWIFLCLVALATTFTLDYLTPQLPEIVSTAKCTYKNGADCQSNFIKENQAAVTFAVGNAITEADRLGEFSKWIPGIMRYDLKFRNRSELIIDITAPEKNLPNKTSIRCSQINKDIPYDSGVLMSRGMKLYEIQENQDEIVEFLNNCLPALQTIKIGETVGPNEKIFFTFIRKFKPMAVPDAKSGLWICLTYFMAGLALLPALRQLSIYCQKGISYFTE